MFSPKMGGLNPEFFEFKLGLFWIYWLINKVNPNFTDTGLNGQAD